MSSAPRPNKIASLLRLPLVSKNFAGTLRQPTYMAIAASLGLHGVVGVGFAVVSPNGLGNSPLATRMVETNLVELTPAEISRLPVVSTLPVGRLPSPNSNTLSAGTLPSLSGLPPSSSGTLGNSGQGLPPGPPPPLGSSEPTYSSGTFFGSRSSGSSEDYSSGYNLGYGSGYSSGDTSSQSSLSLAELQAWIDLQARREIERRLEQDDPNFLKKPQLQDEDDPKAIPNEENEEIADGEEISEKENPNIANSSEFSEGEIRFVQGIRLPGASSQQLEGQIPVEAVVDDRGNLLDLRFPDGSENQVRELLLVASIQDILFPSTGSEAVYPLVVVFNENSPTLNALGSGEQPQIDFEDLQALDPDSEPNTESQIFALAPISYSVADLSIPPGEVPDSIIVDIVVVPDGGIETQLVTSTGDPFLDEIALDRALALAIEQKLALDTSNTHQVTIPFELDVELDDNIETPPEAPILEPTDPEDSTEKPLPPQSPAPDPLEPELPQEDILPSPPNPVNTPKKPPLQNPSEAENESDSRLPELPADKPTQSSTSDERLPIEKERLPYSSKATKKEP
ncbi:hypothetical protein IQ235_08600 [Oscillatoriales cyanobacterium LEGE 11467]|uniref:Uncharacterized protein n=1 Tax=Zarconia navalis LEGE 11467 TaxID=1828826 RepID=A0A928Z6W9_9CYAN|nr:hypothetical protein [Zarconia navalis]MBE9040837.1 hypothetical protein [Zarconia navalis LEGE 11467]